jgi:hypothetical protein
MAQCQVDAPDGGPQFEQILPTEELLAIYRRITEDEIQVGAGRAQNRLGHPPIQSLCMCVRGEAVWRAGMVLAQGWVWAYVRARGMKACVGTPRASLLPCKLQAAAAASRVSAGRPQREASPSAILCG